MKYDKRDIVDTFNTPMYWVKDTTDTIRRLHNYYRWYDNRIFVATNNYIHGRNRPKGQPHYPVPSTIVKSSITS